MNRIPEMIDVQSTSLDLEALRIEFEERWVDAGNSLEYSQWHPERGDYTVMTSIDFAWKAYVAGYFDARRRNTND